MAENPGSVCDDLRELAEVHHAPRGNIAAVYFAITRKYGYTRLESELAHSINVYCRAVPRRIAPLFCNTVYHRCVRTYFMGFLQHTDTHIHTQTQSTVVSPRHRNSARYNAQPPWLEASRNLGYGKQPRFKNRDTRRVYKL